MPIYESDSAEERYQKESWRTFELWEKIEKRLKFRKRVWIGISVFLFLVFSSIPVLQEKRPYWTAQKAGTRLASLLRKTQLRAIQDQGIYRVKFLNEAGLKYVLEKVENCSAISAQWTEKGELLSEAYSEKFQILNLGGDQATFCYDSAKGLFLANNDKNSIQFEIAYLEDLKAGRNDRASFLTLRGPVAEVIFD